MQLQLLHVRLRYESRACPVDLALGAVGTWHRQQLVVSPVVVRKALGELQLFVASYPSGPEMVKEVARRPRAVGPGQPEYQPDCSLGVACSYCF